MWKNHHNLGGYRPRGNESEEDRKSDFSGVMATVPVEEIRQPAWGKWELRFFRNDFSFCVLIWNRFSDNKH